MVEVEHNQEAVLATEQRLGGGAEKTKSDSAEEFEDVTCGSASAVDVDATGATGVSGATDAADAAAAIIIPYRNRTPMYNCVRTESSEGSQVKAMSRLGDFQLRFERADPDSAG